MSGLKLGEVQAFEFNSKLEQFLLYCHLLCPKGGAVTGGLWV